MKDNRYIDECQYERKFDCNESIFFLCFEPREYRLTRVPCWCKRFSYTIKMSGHKTTSRFRKVIQLMYAVQRLFVLEVDIVVDKLARWSYI